MIALLQRLLLQLTNAYLSAFAFFMRDYRHAWIEHSLIISSIREAAAEHVAGGMGSSRALLRSYWEHAHELHPVALILKTWDDAAFGAEGAAGRVFQVGRIAVLVVVLMIVVNLGRSATEGGGAFQVGRPGPVAEGGTAEVLGDGPSLREAIYWSTGVCLDPNVMPHDLTDDLLRVGSPGADCSDLEP